MKKARLDKYLAEHGYSDSREKAKREILAGWVKVNGATCRDASATITGDESIEVSRPKGLFVSRGGYKLERALGYFDIDVKGFTVLDLGASTGGFTDCLLKRNAAKVYAVDVGYGQLDYSLRNDERVVVMERTNARLLTPDHFGDDQIQFIVSDLSFISFTKVFPVIRELFPDCRGVTLIKPQFEAEKGEHKKGVVKDMAVHKLILTRVIDALVLDGLLPLGLTWSPVKGPKGNIEFLLYYRTLSAGADVGDLKIGEVVEEAWEKL